jgi:hypothetical protein
VTEQTPPQQTPPESTIIETAQAFVDSWLRDNKRRPFAPTVAAVGSGWWQDHPAVERQREAFIRVAKAIRAVAGHASAKPEPLFRIARSVLQR